MKLCLLLYGISYNDAYHNYYFDKDFIIDYRHSVENYKKTIYKYFRDLSYDIDVYFCTNYSNEMIHNSLIEDFDPTGFYFMKKEMEESLPDYTNNVIQKNFKIKTVLELVKDSGNEYDLCLLTRFDLFFNIPFSQVSFDFDKINLVSFLEKKNYLCDNFYVFPYRYLDEILVMVEECMDKSFHYIYDRLIQIGEINMIFNQHRRIADLEFYDIVRKEKK